MTEKTVNVSKLLEPLIGQSIRAFGFDSKGIWGQCQTTKTFTIEDVTTDYQEVEKDRNGKDYLFASVNVYLKGYDYRDNGLIYTDPRFERELQALLRKFSIKVKLSYSEQGMQGDSYVNLDATISL